MAFVVEFVLASGCGCQGEGARVGCSDGGSDASVAGDVDFIPTEAFTEAEARIAIAGARFVVETVGKFQV